MEFSDILYILVSLLFSSVTGYVVTDEFIKDNKGRGISISLGCITFVAILVAMMKGIYW